MPEETPLNEDIQEIDREVCREHIISEDYADFIVEYAGVNMIPNYSRYCIQTINKRHLSLYLDRSFRLLQNLSISNFSYSSFPKCFALLDTSALDESGITAIQNQPVLNLRGNGVMVGFIDTGIDYRNDIFKNADGTTRIVRIWDQSVQTGEMPAEISYGSEYTQEMINEALQSENPYDIVPSRDENGHGTYMASVAAGSESRENNFIGAAPDSMIAVVKLKPAKQYLKEYFFINPEAEVYQENDIMLGVRYLETLAASMGVPIVLCIGLGSNMGDHSGNSPLSSGLNDVAVGSGRAVVVATGNEANKGHHYYGSISMDTEYEDVEIQVEENVSGFTVELWAQVPDTYSVSIISPTGEQVPRIPASLAQSQIFSFVFENTRVYVNYWIFEPQSGEQLIFIRFQAPTPGIWTIRVYQTNIINGTYQMWLPIQEFLTGRVEFVRSNPDTTLTVPSGADRVISVAGYNSSNGSIYVDSGRGFTRNGKIRPDFAAPAVSVYGGLPDNQFGRRTGTSAAAAITAGSVALLMEWGLIRGTTVFIGDIQLKNLLIRGATRKPDIVYPDRSWGYGALNVYNVFESLRIT